MPQVGIEPTSPCILVRSSNHYTIRDHHAGNVAGKTAPTPADSAQLRLFLKLVNYYQKFLPNFSDVFYPLHKLLQKNVHRAWSTDGQKSFDKVQPMISTDNVLIPYDSKLRLILYLRTK